MPTIHSHKSIQYSINVKLCLRSLYANRWTISIRLHASTPRFLTSCVLKFSAGFGRIFLGGVACVRDAFLLAYCRAKPSHMRRENERSKIKRRFQLHEAWGTTGQTFGFTQALRVQSVGCMTA
jgi:hypothetical protein